MTKNSNNAFILSVIYRHPSGDVNDFISVLNQKIASFGPKQKCYFLSDLNINVDPNKSMESATDNMHMLSSNNCYVQIDKPTQMENNSNNITGFEINACPRQAEIASGKLFYGLTCPTGKLTKHSISNNIKQDYLETLSRSAVLAIK